MMKRPLLSAALLYASGIVVGHAVGGAVWALLAVAWAAGLAVLLARHGQVYWLGLAVFVAGWANFATRTAIISPHDLRRLFDEAPELVVLRGTLAEPPDQRVFVREGNPTWRTLARIEASAVKRQDRWEPASGEVAVTTPGLLGSEFFEGQTVEVGGVLQRPRLAAAPGAFDQRAYLQGQGVYFALQAGSTNDWHLLTPGNASVPQPWAGQFRAWAQRTLARGLPEEDEALRLIWGMTLGWRAALTQEVSEPFMRSGTLHVFAISGLHIALIAALMVSLLRVFQVPRGVCGIIVIPLIWFYTAATGWQASAIRSTVMMTVIVGGWALRRPTDLLNSLAAAALVILVWDPRQLFQAGFQLSFFAVLGLALIHPPVEKFRARILQADPLLPDELRPRWQRWTHSAAGWVTKGAATSLAAWLGSVPLIAFYFYMVTPVSLFANLIVVPLSSIALASSLGSLVCGDWLPWVTELFNHSSWLWMKLMISSSEWFARLPLAFFYVRPPGLAECAGYYLLLMAALSGWLFRQSHWRWLAPTFGLWAGLLAFDTVARRNDVELTIPPLGGGGIWVDAPGRENDLLVDCGDAGGANLVVNPFLRAQGVNHLPRVLLTHGDIQHVGGFEVLPENFSIGEVLTSDIKFRSPAYREIVKNLEASARPARNMSRGDHIGRWRVLHPATRDRFSHADDSALVLLGDFHGTRVLLLSDLGHSGQRALLRREPDLRADIVVAGLPSQGEPVSDALLAAVQPRAAILASAEFQSNARASRKLRERLETSEIPLLFTDQTGAVQLRITPRGWTLQTMNGVSLSWQRDDQGVVK